MSDFTEQEFNEAMLKLQPEIELLRTSGLRTEVRKMTEYGYTCFNWSPCNDLNQLMPIAWKQNVDIVATAEDGYYGAECLLYDDVEFTDKDPVEAIRQCLWQIYKEQT